MVAADLPKPALVPVPCARCGEMFKPWHPLQRYCGRECYRAADNAAMRHQAKARKRRLRRAETWDGIADEEILDRDGWRCQVPGCKRRPIRKDLRYPHPRSKSVDHIVPLVLGGDDRAENKRAAHLACNIARSANMGTEQMALFGSLRDAPLLPQLAGEPPRPPRQPRLCDCGERALPGKRRCKDCHEKRLAELAARREEKARKLAPRKCSECPTEFVPGGGRWITCSKDCKRRRKRRADRERRWIDPDYRDRAVAATARFHDRQRTAKAAPASGQGALWGS